MDSEVCRRFIGEQGGFGELGDSSEFGLAKTVDENLKQ